MTSNVEALLSFFAKKSQGLKQLRTRLFVIPAKAGIQLNMRPKDTTVFMVSAAHNVFALDSSLLKAEHIPVLSPRAGLRRNDVRFDLASRSAA